MPTITPVGSLVTSVVSGGTTQSVSPTTNGNALCLVVKVALDTTVSVAGGGVTTWNTGLIRTTADNITIAMFFGKITSTGTSTITVTFGQSVVGFGVEIHCQEFSSDSGATTAWVLDDSAFNDQTVTATTTLTFPSLTPATGAGELYFAYCRVGSGASADTTISGTVFKGTANGNEIAYNPAAIATIQPTFTQSPAAMFWTQAILLTAAGSNSYNPPTDIPANIVVDPASVGHPIVAVIATGG